MRYRFGQFRLDLEGRELLSPQGAVPLRPKVFDLLSYLIAQRDRVVSKEELFEQLWPGVVVGEASLNSCIKAARKAVGDDGRSQSIIRTSSKHGYRFVAEVQQDPDAGPSTDVDEPRADDRSQPAIAVLAFNNLSDDLGQVYFSDGITEDIITELSRFHSLSVVARHSSFVYRDQAVDLRQIGRQLDVDFVLEGSVRKLGMRVRITVQLVDTRSGSHLWAERYDRELAEIFDIQDEITATIVASLSGRIASATLAKARRRPPDDWHAYDHYLMARHFSQLPRNSENLGKVKTLAERAIETDPHYAPGYSMLANAERWLAILTDFGDTPRFLSAYGRARENALKASELSPDDAETLRALGWSHMSDRRYAEAERSLQRSYDLNPHDGDLAMSWVTALCYLGRSDEAVALADKTIRRTPSHPDYFLFDLGEAQFFAGDIDRAVANFELVPDAEVEENRALAVAAFAHADRMTEAERQSEAYLQDLQVNWHGDPQAEMAERIAWEFRFRHVYRRDVDVVRLRQGLRKAGLPF